MLKDHARALVAALTSVLLIAGTPAPAGDLEGPSSAAFALHDGDRIVFYGDSITQDGGYGRLVEAYVVSRFPTWNVRFYNSGVGGDRVSGGWAGGIDERLARDVIALEPTVVTIMLGMNDGGYKPYDPVTFAAYAHGYRAIVRTLKEALPGVRLTLIQPSPFDDVARPPRFAPGYDDILRRYGCYVGELAKREGARVVDLRAPVNAGVAAVLESNPALARQILPDRVHPSDAGHIVMGAALLRGWDAPALVTRVEIDAATPRLLISANTEVTELQSVDGVVSWTQLDRALPLPLNFKDATVELAEAAGAALETLDGQPLVVTGLPRGQYELRIDDQTVGAFAGDELAAGLNLATFNTPMRRQAFSIRRAAKARLELRRVQRQLLAGGSGGPEWKETAERLEAFDEAMQAERGDAARPVPRHYRLVPR
jgi:lysophospholipase L1-like esterase